jgi:cell division protein FtsL
MLKLFRKIRHRFLQENRFNKYLLYAIGEIILVVIGILIALQINNWNTERQQRNLEVKILKEIQTNLSFDLIEIREDISVMDSIILASKEVIEFINTNDKPSTNFNYNVSKLKVVPHFNPNKSGYELLVSKGVEVIRNDSLRATISKLYESSYPYYEKYEEERIHFKATHLQPILIKYFTWFQSDDRAFFSDMNTTLKDFTELKESGDFLKVVNAASFESWFVQYRANDIERQIVDLIMFIENELKTDKSFGKN